MTTVDLFERAEKQGAASPTASTHVKRGGHPGRAIDIIDDALSGSMDEELTVDRESLRRVGREIAVERHGEDFVAEFEARLRGQ